MKFTVIFLLALISFNLAYKSPADKVLSKIDSLVTLARNEQASQTRLYVAQHERCVKEQAFRRKEIAEGEVASGAADQQLLICQAEIPVARAAKSQSTSELKASNEQLKALNIEFSLFQQVNLARQAEHKEAIENIQTAYNIIGSFANGKSALSGSALFLEVSQKINKVYRTAIKHKFHSAVLPVIQAMIEMSAKPATQVSTSSLHRVVTLLRKLEADIKHQESVRAANWKAFENQSHEQNQLLNVQIKALGSIIVKYRNYLQNLHQCVRSERHILNLANAKVARNSQILAATVQMCNAYDAKYTSQSKQRHDYVKMMGQLRHFVRSAIGNFKSGLYSRGDYVNQ